MLCRTVQFSNAHRRVSIIDGSRIVNGSEFHKVGPETAKYFWPYLVLERGTARSPHAAERR